MEYILITNNSEIAQYAQDCGVHRIMVDLEIKGKKERQGHLNTVISNHSLKDIENIRKVISISKLLVRVNPIDNESKDEIQDVINLGADIVMLPMFTEPNEVKLFISYINGKAKNCLLLETPQALVRVDDFIKIPNVNEIHIGLNDLHLGLKLSFMFELLSGGIVEYLSKKICSAGINFGFGGIAKLGKGLVDSSLILSEHYRLNSKIVILSRDFQGDAKNYKEFREQINLKLEIEKINNYLKELETMSQEMLISNKLLLKSKINDIVYNQ